MTEDQQPAEKFPVFRNPEEYMAMRHKPGLGGRAKVWAEYRALDRCLDAVEDVRTVVDVPSGPGRLFPYWKERGYRVIGLDYSEEMVEASTRLHADLGLEGRVAHANAFELPQIEEQPDLVASVRFAYYFTPERRIELLESLARASSRYLLVMYKTTETLKGYINEANDREVGKAPRLPHMAKAGCSHHQIVREFAAAGLAVLRIQPIGEFSDRVYVLAEKVSREAAAPTPGSELALHVRSGGRTGLGLLVLGLLFTMYMLSMAGRELWRKPEAQLALSVRAAVEGNWAAPWTGDSGAEALHALPLVWSTALIGAATGNPGELHLRFANAACLLLALLIFPAMGRLLRNRYVGLIGALMLATCWGFWKLAWEVRPETVAMLLVGASWLVAWHGVKRGGSWRLVLSWGLAGLAALSEGWAPLVLAAGAWALLPRLLRLHGMPTAGGGLARVATGLAIGLLPTIAWYGAAALTGEGPAAAAWLRALWLESIGWRVPWSVAWDLFEATLPWGLLLPAVLWSRFSKGGRQRHGAFEDYSLAVVLLMLVVGVFCPREGDEDLVVALPWALLPCATLGWRWLLWVDREEGQATVPERRFWGTMLGRRGGRVFLGIAGMLIAFYGAAMIIVPAVQRDEDSPRAAVERLLRRAAGAAHDDAPLVFHDLEDPRLTYYAAPHAILVREKGAGQTELRAVLARHPHAVLAVPADDKHEMGDLLAGRHLLGTVPFRGHRILVYDAPSAE
ncbi:MAG: methyltransferase domain-containing protein [Candidatus Sumerlaeia bacterium]|nr:methyltransferase domain-containing protein [Candidatus Sumerlaeia bacterium]